MGSDPFKQDEKKLEEEKKRLEKSGEESGKAAEKANSPRMDEGSRPGRETRRERLGSRDRDL